MRVNVKQNVAFKLLEVCSDDKKDIILKIAKNYLDNQTKGRILRLLHGEDYIPSGLTNTIVAPETTTKLQLCSIPADREARKLFLLFEAGLTLQSMADALHMSPSTVRDRCIKYGIRNKRMKP